MKKHLILIVPALLISLFIYLFYRTEKTLINELFAFFISKNSYSDMRSWINLQFPLHKAIIFSLPEGLWVFCITLTSKHLYFKFAKREIDCAIIPLLFSIGLEFLQLFHITNGRFDLLDILISVFFWFTAYFIVDYQFSKENPFKSFSMRTIAFLTSYAIVYLAHVFPS